MAATNNDTKVPRTLCSTPNCPNPAFWLRPGDNRPMCVTCCSFTVYRALRERERSRQRAIKSKARRKAEKNALRLRITRRIRPQLLLQKQPAVRPALQKHIW